MKKRVGFKIEGKSIVREGYKIFRGNEEVGITSSGIYSPSLQRCIGMAYINQE